MHKILLIEDDEDVSVLTSLTLQQHGLDVETCANASDGLNKILEQDFELILLDLTLPDRHGLLLLEDVRRKRPEYLKRIALFSAADRRETHQAALTVAGVLEKPFEPRQLAGQVLAMIHTTT